ncbi:sodium- and chloride-dependent glycine transporter 2-like [Mytilus trossulus]|uniref:sodium- and chloride-dependent glycine transporter 2-like n=1 Tax=Mytilus trossulus TaxID=6551 RepID=UPI003004B753
MPEPKLNRETWGSWFEFVFSCIGSMVGLGNVWRFPYICFKNGGGAFLIPYFIFMFAMAMPLMFMEFSIAQYSSLGPGRLFLCCPLFKGIGYGIILMCVISASYYSTVISWTLFYLGNSFLSPLPWTSCNNTWNTQDCYIRSFSEGDAMNSTVTFSNITQFNNGSVHVEAYTSSEEFWENRVLGLTSSINNIGILRWELVLCSLGTWTVVILALIKGIKSSGKFMLFASTLPYVFLLILLIRGLLLPGALDGIKYFFIPRWQDLKKFSVWSDAAVQVFYSSSLGIGELLTLSSHNRFKNNCQRDAMILPFVDAFTSIFAGCVIFSTLGYTAAAANLDIDMVVKQGPGIAFVVYPDALATLPFPQIWSALFFLLLFMIGTNSLVVVVQVIGGGMFDTFPNLSASKRTLVTMSICLLGFLTTLIYTTQGGMYVLQLVDWYLSSIPRMFIMLLESIVIIYIYGVRRLSKDIEMMLGKQPSKIWKFFWLFVTPPLLTIIWVIMVFQLKTIKYGEIPYPSWSIAFGWILGMVPIFIILPPMIYTVWKQRGSFIQRLRKSIQPSYLWKAVVPNDFELQSALSK